MGTVPENARLIGYLGGVPLVVFALSFVAGWPFFPGFALQGFMVYSALLLGFLGGIRWGAAMNLKRQMTWELWLSMAPLTVAWIGVIVDPRFGVLVLGAGFLAAWLYGVVAEPPAAPGWYPVLRTQLTVPVLLCHALMAYALFR